MRPSESPKKASNPASGKKEYLKPRLTTFGNVSKITQGGGTHVLNDTMGSMRMADLMGPDM